MTKEIQLQQKLEAEYSIKPQVFELSDTFMAEVADKAKTKGLQEISLVDALQELAIFQSGQTPDENLDPFAILVEYLKIASANGTMVAPEGFLTIEENGQIKPGALEQFAQGEKLLSYGDTQTLVEALEIIQKHGFDETALNQAVNNVKASGKTDPRPVWSKYLLGEKGVKILTDKEFKTFRAVTTDPKDILGTTPTTKTSLVGETTKVGIEDIAEEAPLANLWLLALYQYGDEIPLQEIGLANTHGPLSYLSAPTLDVIIKIFDEKSLIRPLPLSTQKTLKEVLEVDRKGSGKDQITLPTGFKFTKEERTVLAKVLEYSENPSKIQKGILATTELETLKGLKPKCDQIQAGISPDDPNKAKAQKLATKMTQLKDNLTPISEREEGLDKLINFVSLMKAGKFRTADGIIIDRVYSLNEIPQDMENIAAYKKGIKVLTALADGLREGTVHEEDMPTDFWGKAYHMWIEKGMKESLMAMDASTINGVGDGDIQLYKHMFFYGEAKFASQVKTWDSELGGKMSTLAKTNHDAEKMDDDAQKHYEIMQDQVKEIKQLRKDINLYLKTHQAALNKPENMGVRAKLYAMLAKTYQADNWLLDIEKALDFKGYIDEKLKKDKGNKAKRREFVQQCLEPKPKKDKDKKIRKEYLEFIKKYEPRYTAIDDDRDGYDSKANHGDAKHVDEGLAYLNSEAIDKKFLETFVAHFGGNPAEGDYGAFEINFDLVPELTNMNMVLKDDQGNNITTGQDLYGFVNRVFAEDNSSWISLAKDPTDDFETSRRAKQAFALVLQGMPANEVSYDPIQLGINTAGGLFQHKAWVMNNRYTKPLFNPGSVGLISYAKDKLGLTTETKIGGGSLEEMANIVNDPALRRNYQVAQTASSMSKPISSQTINMSKNARIIFDQSLGAHNETELDKIGHQTVAGASLLLEEMNSVIADPTQPNHLTAYRKLLDSDQISIDIVNDTKP